MGWILRNCTRGKKNQAKSQHRIASKYAYAAFGLHLLAG